MSASQALLRFKHALIGHRWRDHPRGDYCDCGVRAQVCDFLDGGYWIVKSLQAHGGLPASWLGRTTPEWERLKRAAP